MVHVEFRKAGGTESMSAVNHDPGNTVISIIILLAELAFFFVKKLVDELIYLLSIEVRGVLCLLEEEGGWVFEFLHLIQKI